uniref:Cyclase/dehydrase n=1 Tax=Solibacter usitatus (strain Ellin6076) TaxID=234267 RepID=Q022X0_SOLUE
MTMQSITRERAGQPQYGATANGTDKLARSLGWFSIGLGLAEVLAPRSVAKAAGTRNHTGWVRAFGVREIVSGVGILTNPQPSRWVWSRVGGDLLDLAALGASLKTSRNGRASTAFSLAAVASITALDILAAKQLTARETDSSSTQHLKANVIVNRSPEDCYRQWRNFRELPRFMSYLESVRETGDGRTHWVAAGPGGSTAEWDAELVEDVPGERISWRSLASSEICNSGSVEFEKAPGGRGTMVGVQMDFNSPAGAVIPLTRMFGRHPEQMVDKDLRRFKQVMETGEAITTEGQPAGRQDGTTWLDSIAK